MIKKSLLVLMTVFFLAGCGPDTIFVRPGLDTPEHHAAAGYQLLERGRIEDALREFARSKELEPRFVKAHVGIGLALGHKGQIDAGRAAIDHARQLAHTPLERQAVLEGYHELEQIKNSQRDPLLP